MKLRMVFTLMAAVVMPAFGQSTTARSLTANGAHMLDRPELERLLVGARVTIGNPAEVTRSWTHNGRGNILATLDNAGGKRRPLNGKGTARIEENGAYCVHIDWPRSDESWCRHVFSLHGAYYAVADDINPAQVVPLNVIQPNAKRLSALGRMWSLARMATSSGVR